MSRASDARAAASVRLSKSLRDPVTPPSSAKECEARTMPCCGRQFKDVEFARLTGERDAALGRTDLERGLSEFRSLMLAKFEKVASKHRETVTVDGNLDRMDGGQVLWHFIVEIGERLHSEKEDRDHRAGEDVDVANMAFLDWWIQRREARRALSNSEAKGGGT